MMKKSSITTYCSVSHNVCNNTIIIDYITSGVYEIYSNDKCLIIIEKTSIKMVYNFGC
jgi:hypothetical protein